MSLSPQKLSAYWRLMRFDKPIGTLLLLWPTFWAIWLATQGQPSLSIVVIFFLGVVLMRAAGCVINDYADRKVDGHVKRTQGRPLATGELTTKEAKGLFLLLILLSFGLVLLLNPFTIFLSFIALLLAATYPFMKRYTHLPQVVLGAAFGFGIPMVFSATQNALPLEAWLLFAANLSWTVAYDTQYAMVDRDDDLKIGVKSTAILFGRFDLLIIALLQLFTLILLVILGLLLNLTFWYYLSLIASAGLFIYQYLVTKARERDRCFYAFRHNNWVGLVIFIGLIVSFY